VPEINTLNIKKNALKIVSGRGEFDEIIVKN
jgi:hypothetical protein